MEFCIPDLVRGIGAVVGDRDAFRTPHGAIAWRDLVARTDAFARALTAAGIGGDVDTSRYGTLDERLTGVQPHLAILSGNSVEYLETMLAAYAARAVPVNLNYRYTADELVYVLRDANAAAVVYQPRYGTVLARALETLGSEAPQTLIAVDDGSGAAPLAGSVAYEDFVARGLPGGVAATVALPTPTGDDRYLIYTGGTTGFPKGVIWRQADLYFAALGGNQRGWSDPQELFDHVAAARPLPGLPASPYMHGAGHWAALILLLQGGTVCLPPNPDTLDPAGIWSTIDRDGVVYLQIVGDAFLGPLLDELDRAPAGTYDLSTLRFIQSSGAISSPARKQALLARLPRVRYLDAMGSSESGATAVAESAGADTVAEKATFTLHPSAAVLDPETFAKVGPGVEGLLAQSGAVPLGYFKDREKTAATFPVVDGVRYSLPGDHAVILDDGRLLLLGRGSQCINTGGEKVFPEEVEAALKAHPDVFDALVAAVADDRFGQAVGAVVASRPGTSPTPESLGAHLRTTLAGYKVPRHWVVTDAVQRNPVGKPDYAWARATLAAHG